jgi:DNA invertase Pin-like site-specific DNA recombinase
VLPQTTLAAALAALGCTETLPKTDIAFGGDPRLNQSLPACTIDRLGRSLQDLIGFLSELHALGIDLALHQLGIDTTTPTGKAMFQMMGVFAEFERSMIVERVRAGVARAKATGTKSGKAFGRPRTAPEVEQRILEALATPGRPGFHKIAAQFGGS